jgi:eukaryotic-like serine/threonine-protein kinase
MTEQEWEEAWRLCELAGDLPDDEINDLLAASESNPTVVQQMRLVLHDSSASLEALQAVNRVGSKIARYLITELIGRGGMGEVYSAKDTELLRNVALKFPCLDFALLHPQIGSLIEEARAASSLNHPNIVTIYEVVESPLGLAIAMELVQGKPLRQFCDGPMLTREVLHIGQQIASALAAAHEHGIVHRDVKPENVMVRADGYVKVTDFGLAQRSSPGCSHDSDGVPSEAAGTVRYMSPEQGRREPLTGASDVFSLGVVLYEMCTGTHPFEKGSLIERAEAVAEYEPQPASALNRLVPADLSRLIQAMLNKDAEARPSATAVVEQLSAIAIDSAARRTGWAQPVGLLSAILLLSAGAIFWLFNVRQRRDTPVAPVPITSYGGQQVLPSLSPDGTSVAYEWNGPDQNTYHVYIERIGSHEPVRLTSEAAPEFSPAWSPDGNWIAFVRKDTESHCTILLAQPSGRGQRTVGESGACDEHARALAWTPDSKWLLTRKKVKGLPAIGIYMTSLASGEMRPLTSPHPGEFDAFPAVSPDGRRLAFVRRFLPDISRVCVARLGPDYRPKDSLRMLNWPGFEAVQKSGLTWTSNGHDLLFISDRDGRNALWRYRSGSHVPELVPLPAADVDSPTLSVRGQHFAFSEDRSRASVWRADLRALGVGGVLKGTEVVVSSRRQYRPQVSPDGTKLAYECNRSGAFEIWVSDLLSGTAKQLTHLRTAASGSPRWSPDGKSILFDSRAPGRPQVYRVNADGSGIQQITHDAVNALLPQWAPDGAWIYFVSSRSTQVRIWRMRPDGTQLSPVTMYGAFFYEITPDGRWIYFQGEGTGPLYRAPASGGPESMIVPLVHYRDFAVDNDGLYFLSPNPNGHCSLRLLSCKDNRIHTVGSLDADNVPGISLSPDGRYLYYAKTDSESSDIMLVDDFR